LIRKVKSLRERIGWKDDGTDWNWFGGMSRLMIRRVMRRIKMAFPILLLSYLDAVRAYIELLNCQFDSGWFSVRGSER